MERGLLQVLRSRGSRRGPRRAGMPSLLVKGERRAPGNWLVGDFGTPAAADVAVDLVVGEDPRRSL